MYHNNTWGTICGNDFDRADAIVACRQLGYTSLLNYRKNSQTSPVIGPWWIKNYNCYGNETSLMDCPLSSVVPKYCSNLVTISLSCFNGKLISSKTHTFLFNFINYLSL